MNSFQLSLKAVFPLFCMISLGYCLKRLRLIDKSTIHQMNGIIFRVFIPATLFINIYQTDVGSGWNFQIAVFTVVSVLFTILSSIIIVSRIEKNNAKKGVLIQCSFRSNAVLFGLPIAASISGENNLAVVSMLIAIIVPVYNISSVVILEYYGKRSMSIMGVLTQLIKNPLIIAALAAYALMNFKLPGILISTVSDMAAITTPLALVLLGADFSFTSLGRNRKQVIMGCLMRLILYPALFLSAGVMLGFRGTELTAITAIFAPPVAVASYSMAEQMGADGELAGLLVIFTTCVSLVTLFVIIYILSQLKLI